MVKVHRLNLGRLGLRQKLLRSIVARLSTTSKLFSSSYGPFNFARVAIIRKREIANPQTRLTTFRRGANRWAGTSFRTGGGIEISRMASFSDRVLGACTPPRN